ncbi:MAG: BsuPI-related putative proteinase inhibitor [Bacillus sp. (in: firmicutes)]
MKRIFIILTVLFICFVFIEEVQAKRNANLLFTIHAITRTDEVELQLKLSNLGNQPKKLHFSSSQKYEISIKSEMGEEVYRYSLNKAFLQAIQDMTLKPNESYRWKEKWDYKNNGKRVEAGDYTVEAVLASTQLDNPQEKIKTVATITVPEKNTMYKNIKVDGNHGHYTITGIAKTPNKLLYTVEDGHNELLSNQVVEKQADGRFTIQLKIPEKSLPKNGTLILYLIEEAENYTDPFPVELEFFS